MSRILIVDDEESIRNALRQVFEYEEHEVAMAADGPEALAFTKQQNSDITPGGEFKKDAPPAQLYDLDADLSQMTNLYDQHPELVAQLKRRLGQILQSPTRPGSESIATEAK